MNAYKALRAVPFLPFKQRRQLARGLLVPALLLLCAFGTGCASTGRTEAVPPPPIPASTPTEGTPVAGESPETSMNRLRAAVGARNLEQARTLFARSFQPTFASWERQIGAETLLDMFASGVSSKACSGGYEVICSSGKNDAVVVTPCNTWNEVLDVLPHAPDGLPATVQYCGYTWTMDSGRWVLAYW